MDNRYDSTQRIYELFINNKNGQLLGFSAAGAIILTDDKNIYDFLIQFENERRKSIYKEHGESADYQIQKYQSFGLSDDELSPTLVLKDCLKNAIYCKHQQVDDWILQKYCGGGQAVIFAENPERIKDYLSVLVDAYLKEMQISIDSMSYDKKVPSLYMQISVNNREEILPNEGVFNTKFAVSTCAETIKEKIESSDKRESKYSDTNATKR